VTGEEAAVAPCTTTSISELVALVGELKNKGALKNKPHVGIWAEKKAVAAHATNMMATAQCRR